MSYTLKASHEAPDHKNDSKADTVNSRNDSAPHLLPLRHPSLPPLPHLHLHPQPPRLQPPDRLALHPTALLRPPILHRTPDTPKCWHHLLQGNVLRSFVSIFHFFLQTKALSTVFRRRGRDLLACWARNGRHYLQQIPPNPHHQLLGTITALMCKCQPDRDHPEGKAFTAVEQNQQSLLIPRKPWRMSLGCIILLIRLSLLGFLEASTRHSRRSNPLRPLPSRDSYHLPKIVIARMSTGAEARMIPRKTSRLPLQVSFVYALYFSLA